ncbi:MAG: family 43 glycosylhydrolase [Bacteroidota bacterium]
MNPSASFLLLLTLCLALGCDQAVEPPEPLTPPPGTAQAIPLVDASAHDPSHIRAIAPGVYSLFASSNPDFGGRLRQFILDTNEPEPAWALVEHWPTLTPRADMAWHVAWMEAYGYDAATQIEHTELAAVAPTLYDASTVYFHLYNPPGRAWAAAQGEEPAMFAALYRATAAGTYPTQTWAMDPVPVYYSDDTTWARGGPRAVDAQVWDGTEGQRYLTFGSWDPAQQHVIAIADLDAATGRIVGFDADTPGYYPEGGHPSIHPIATFGEGAYSFHRDGFYYLFLNLGGCCSGLDSTYEIVVGRSRSVFGPYLDDRGRSFMDRYENRDCPNTEIFPGTSVLAGLRGQTRFIGPGHTGLFQPDDDTLCLSFHFYDGEDDGRPKAATRPLAFDAENWPYVVADAPCTLGR